MGDYLDIVYSRNARPLTEYPEKLVDYIIEVCELDVEARLSLIEPGVGYGDHLRLFKRKGFEVRGLDVSPRSVEMSPDLDIELLDSDGKVWPYPDSEFDVVYSKSFIEHLSDPQSYLAEAYRVLKPGGVIVTLTPDWVSGYKKFFDDYTHKSPFTAVSLRNITVASGFINVNAYAFRQLPFTWKSPFLNMLCAIMAPFFPANSQIKIFRWSRELMLIGYGMKPKG